MRKIQVAVCTISREPIYVHQTLSSLLQCDPAVEQLDKIWLMAGSSETDYLNRYRHDSRFRIEAMGQREWDAASKYSVFRRMLINYSRCLSIPRNGHTGLLVVEDDVKFRDGFFTKLNEVLDQVEDEMGQEGFILSCYSGYDFRLAADRPGKLYCQHPYKGFYGTQAHYFPRDAWTRIGLEMMVKASLCYEWPTDILLGILCKELDIKILTPRVALVQHIGVISTGCNEGKFHENLTFNEPWLSDADQSPVESNFHPQPENSGNGDLQGVEVP